jgi:hypothetical protein
MYGVALQKYLVAGCMLGLLSSSALASAQDHDSNFITFQVPHSAYTSPIAINNALTVMGVYADEKNNYHGFIREVSGRIISFDPPESTYTLPSGLNDSGAITGFYADSTGTHGFLRSPEGAFTSFDVPGSGVTLPVGINDSDAIAGYYTDPNPKSLVTHGFVRSRHGEITTFDAGPAGGMTIPAAINRSGIITGRVQAQSPFGGGLIIYAFERSPQGEITQPGIQEPYGINAEGAIVGITGGTPGLAGAIVSPEGALTTFQAQGAYTTLPTTINGEGAVAGQYFVALGNNDTHGFVRSPEGTITSFDPPGSTRTDVSSINDFGILTGEMLRANNIVYGFLRIPDHCGWLLEHCSDDGPR